MEQLAQLVLTITPVFTLRKYFLGAEMSLQSGPLAHFHVTMLTLHPHLASLLFT